MYRIIVDVKSRTPIYEQLIESVKDSVVKGFMRPDEPMPSVRQLASELAINPNTIQKAYAELERRGIVYSVPGKGSFVSSDVVQVKQAHKDQLSEQIKKLLVQAKESGESAEDVIKIVNEIWR